MLTKAQNELLTRVCGDAPMGKYMREQTWIPFAVKGQIEPYDAPLKVRLLGENYVAWRSPDGRVGFIEEACPHRRASMALARNEGCILRCIFHGWAIDVSGKVVEAATHSPDPDEFAARVKVKHYPVHEAGDLLWVYLGQGEAPAFQELPFTIVPEDQVWMSVTKAACNWLQGVEGSLDSAHVGTLHSSWLNRVADYNKNGGKAGANRFLKAVAPQYQVKRTPWGLAAIALRSLDEGITYVRATQYVAPYINMVPRDPIGNGSIFIAVPVDDENHLLFFGYFSQQEKLNDKSPRVQALLGGEQPPKHNFAPFKGSREDNYGQDRELMKQGHFTGFGHNLLAEDIVVQVSMGPITDRTKENLSSSDVAIARARSMLLQLLKNVDAGLPALAPHHAQYEAHDALPVDLQVPAGTEWEDAVRSCVDNSLIVA